MVESPSNSGEPIGLVTGLETSDGGIKVVATTHLETPTGRELVADPNPQELAEGLPGESDVYNGQDQGTESYSGGSYRDRVEVEVDVDRENGLPEEYSRTL